MVKIRHLDKGIKVREVRKQEDAKTDHSKKKHRYGLWFIAIFSLAFLFFALSFLFSKAEVVVISKTENVVLNENLSASKDSNTDGLSFDLVVISGEENKIIKTTEEKDIKERAMGAVMLYNIFSSSPQVFSADTRLEGSNDKIYKTQTKITVPGKSKNGTPGSIEVKIYGENAGEEYNSAPLDFKILGFKGTPKYSKFYGRSKGEITGGFVGKAPFISDTEKTSAISDLKTSLQAKLFKKVVDQIPNGFVLFKDAVFFNINSTDVPFVAKNNNLTVTLKGTLYGLLFNEQKLTKKIASDTIEKYDGSDVFIPNIKDLSFSLSPGEAGMENKDSVSFDNIKNINFNLSGKALIVWKLNVDKFINDLLGKSKNDFNLIISQYPNINSATLSLSPMWRISFPDQAKDIKVTINY